MKATSVKLASPGTKQWLKEMDKALKVKSFKVKLPCTPLKPIDIEHIPPVARGRMRTARKFLEDNVVRISLH